MTCCGGARSQKCAISDYDKVEVQRRRPTVPRGHNFCRCSPVCLSRRQRAGLSSTTPTATPHGGLLVRARFVSYLGDKASALPRCNRSPPSETHACLQAMRLQRFILSFTEPSAPPSPQSASVSSLLRGVYGSLVLLGRPLSDLIACTCFLRTKTKSLAFMHLLFPRTPQ